MESILQSLAKVEGDSQPLLKCLNHLGNITVFHLEQVTVIKYELISYHSHLWKERFATWQKCLEPLLQLLAEVEGDSQPFLKCLIKET